MHSLVQHELFYTWITTCNVFSQTLCMHRSCFSVIFRDTITINWFFSVDNIYLYKKHCGIFFISVWFFCKLNNEIPSFLQFLIMFYIHWQSYYVCILSTKIYHIIKCSQRPSACHMFHKVSYNHFIHCIYTTLLFIII